MLLAAALLAAGLGDFQLEAGRVLEDLRSCYRTYGNKNATGTNVILFPTWFNGTMAQLETYIEEVHGPPSRNREGQKGTQRHVRPRRGAGGQAATYAFATSLASEGVR